MWSASDHISFQVFYTLIEYLIESRSKCGSDIFIWWILAGVISEILVSAGIRTHWLQHSKQRLYHCTRVTLFSITIFPGENLFQLFLRDFWHQTCCSSGITIEIPRWGRQENHQNIQLSCFIYEFYFRELLNIQFIFFKISFLFDIQSDWAVSLLILLEFSLRLCHPWNFGF